MSSMFTTSRKHVVLVGVLVWFVGVGSARAQQWVTYDASLNTLPTEQCFSLYTFGTQPRGVAAPAVVDGRLHLGPTPSDCILSFQRSDFPLSLEDGVTFGAELEVISSGYGTVPGSNWIRAGFGMYVQDAEGHGYEVWIGDSKVCFANNFYEVLGDPGVLEISVDTHALHTYEVTAFGGNATLRIDGVVRATIVGYGPNYGASGNGIWSFGDETDHPWATSEINLTHAWCSGIGDCGWVDLGPRVTYDASLNTLPTQQCFSVYTFGAQPTGAAAPSVVDGRLHVGPTPSDCILSFQRSDFPLSFEAGVTFGAELEVLSSGYGTVPGSNWIRAGFGMYVQDAEGHGYEVWIGDSKVCFANNFYEVSGDPGVHEISVDTHALHTYEVTAFGGNATLRIDGVVRATIVGYGPNYGTSSNGIWSFGDETDHPWATSEFNLTRAWCSGIGGCDCIDLDSTPPMITIGSPSNGAILGTTSVTLAGSVTDDCGSTVESTPAGVSATLAAGTSPVSGTVPLLVEGENILSLSATDAAGNAGGTSIMVIRDTIPPAIEVLTPPEGAILGIAPAGLTIRVTDATATSVVFGGNSASVAAGGGQVSGDVSLDEGFNSIAITATDAAGNTASVDHPLLLDLTAPVVMIQSPLNGECFGPGDSPIAVVASVDDLTATQVASTPAGVTASLPAGGGLVSGAVQLSEGTNTITVSATDDVSRTGSASIAVLLDTTPPLVTLDSPASGAFVRGTIDLHASAQDVVPGTGVSQVDLEADAVLVTSITAPPYETFFDTTSVPDGSHSFTAVGYDGKNNSASAGAFVIVDNTPPSIAVTTPGNGWLVSGNIPFGVSASDATSGLTSIRMLAGGAAPTVDDSILYVAPVASDSRLGEINTTAFLDGALELAALAKDAAGNESLATATVTVDNTAPEKSLISPTDGSVVSGTMQILASANDSNLDSLEIRVDNVSLGSSTVSPFSVSFDTGSRLDGTLQVTVIATDLAGNTSTCTASVTVDNITVCLRPRTLNLKSKGGDHSVTGIFEGASVALLLPPELHHVELRVPGGNPVPATPGFGSLGDEDDDGIPDTVLKFDRQALIASIRAGIAGGHIQPESSVTLAVVAEGGTVIGTDVIRIVGR